MPVFPRLQLTAKYVSIHGSKFLSAQGKWLFVDYSEEGWHTTLQTDLWTCTSCEQLYVYHLAHTGVDNISYSTPVMCGSQIAVAQGEWGFVQIKMHSPAEALSTALFASTSSFIPQSIRSMGAQLNCWRLHSVAAGGKCLLSLLHACPTNR